MTTLGIKWTKIFLLVDSYCCTFVHIVLLSQYILNHPESLWKNKRWLSTGCLKKTHHKEMCDFLTLKMLPLALALIKTKNRNLFDLLVKNCPFSMENSLHASKALNSHVKWAFSDQWVKKMAIFCFDRRQSQWYHF